MSTKVKAKTKNTSKATTKRASSKKETKVKKIKSIKEEINKPLTDIKTKIKDESEFNYDVDTWKVIDSYFAQDNHKQIVKHQLESFQHFIDPQLKQIIHQFNPVIIYHDYVQDFNKHRVELHMEFRDYSIGKPLIYENDGSTQTMTPALARLRHLTYASPLSININMKRILRTGDQLEKDDAQELMLHKINFGKIPIMIQSKYCVLNEGTGIDVTHKGECRYDKGSCFIVGGNEKVVVSQERIAENKVFVFNNQRQTKSIDAEIKSVSDKQFSVAMSNAVRYIFKTGIIEVDTPNFRTPINIFLVMKALGISTDKKLTSMIVWDVKNEKINELTLLLKQTLENYNTICINNNITTVESAREYLVKYTNFKGINKEIKMTPSGKLEYLYRSFNVEILPHLGVDYIKKAHFLGYMVQKLLKVYLGYIPYDDRDSYQNKRVDTPGVLMAGLFRQCFNRLVKDIKKSISKELKSNKSGKDVFEIINSNNIYKIVKPTIIEGGLKFSLATGNWSVKNNNNPKQKAKIGTAQVLNRLGNQSCISHLRRINSPSEKNNGKIVAPRKIHATQWGYLCPAETPEGAPVGLVKNMALTCQVTISTNSEPVRQWFLSNDVKPISDSNTVDFLHNGKIFINGDWIGIHYKPEKLVANFKKARRSAQINIYTSINWDVLNNDIFVYTDAGRVTRPLYVVNNNKLTITKEIVQHSNMSNLWNNLLFPNLIDKLETTTLEGVVEYIDCEEADNCLIAVKAQTLQETYEPYNCKFTHCEIHPGLILGAIGCIIPFPDHNQSPRNTYQSAMSKQSMGICATNFLERMDTLSYVMNNIERPIVGTKFSKYVNYNTLPNGLNTVIAIASYTGYNQEDSLILNQHALDRGLFRATFYRTYKDDEKKIQSSGKEEKFCRPNSKYTRGMKPGNYNKLDDRGFVKKDLYVDSRDIIIGKVLPLKSRSELGHMLHRDCSTSLRINETGFVDRVYTNRNADGFKFGKIRIRSERIPQIGDKFSSRCGQKGTVGVTLPQEQMPFNKDGISPDAIMNPHAIPSRMTIGQLLECILGKAAVIYGGFADCTSFTEIDPDKIGDLLELNGLERCGNEILYNGVTGTQMDCQIFMGPTYYQRLKHMVEDKMHCLKMDHEVLTMEGWKFFNDITIDDKIATLNPLNNNLEYNKPIQIHYYPNYEGKMYHICNSSIDLYMTDKHRIYCNNEIDKWTFQTAQTIYENLNTNKHSYYNIPFMNNINNKFDFNSINKFEIKQIDHEKCDVFCLTVPNEIFYVRRNNKCCWTGNSRASGPVVQLTRQPAEGRSRDGGLRIGEMERDCEIYSSPITQSNGLSIKIGEMEDCNNEVLGWNKEEDGLVKAKQTGFMCKGERKCVKLTFEDGRTTTCTPKHPLLTSENKWIKAKDLKIGVDKIKAGVNYPVIDIKEEMKSCKNWKLNVGTITLTCNSKEEYFESMAFARILGYLITDGHITKQDCIVSLGHMLDVESFINDLELFQEIEQTNFISKNHYIVRFKRDLTYNITQLKGLTFGKKVIQPAVLPEFILDENCPKPIIREFLAGMFGGDGHTCYLGMHRGKRDLLTSISFSKTKSYEHKESLQKMMEDIQKLLKKFDINKTTIQKSKETTHSKKINKLDVNKDQRHYQLLLHLDIDELISFSEKIGFRYCCHKSQRLEAGVAYKRLRDEVIRQRKWITNRVNELTDYVKIKTQFPKKNIQTKKAIEQAVVELEKTEPLIHKYAIPTRHSINEHLLRKTSFGKFNSKSFPTAEQFMKKIGTYEWFINENVKDCKKSNDKISYGVCRDIKALPTMNLTLIDRRDDGIHKVYDIEVEDVHSFVTNGIVAHNCMIAHGALGFLKERMMDVSDLFTIYVCKGCGLFADVNSVKEIYRCSGCEQSSDFAKINIPYACKLLMQELQGMSIAPRLKF